MDSSSSRSARQPAFAVLGERRTAAATAGRIPAGKNMKASIGNHVNETVMNDDDILSVSFALLH